MSNASITELLARLEELAPVLRKHADEADRLARLPDECVRVLFEMRLLRLWIPKRHDGFELDLPQTLAVYEAAASIDGSFGWAVMIGAGGGLFAAYLDAATADEIFADPKALIAGSGAPRGWAERVPGGYRASGRWRYASGAHYASTFTANCILTENGQPILNADGSPRIRAMAFTPDQVTIVPSWDTSGMRGTGSHDFEVVDAFVPERRTFSVFTDVPRESGPLYRLPFDVLTELPVAAVAIGIARHSLDSFAALAQQKKAHSAAETLLASDPTVRACYAQSHARWRFAQARLHSLATLVWQEALANRPPSRRLLAEITATSSLCVSDLCTGVGELARLAGMTAITSNDEFARTWRDLQTLGAHVSVSPRRLAEAGSVLLEDTSTERSAR